MEDIVYNQVDLSLKYDIKVESQIKEKLLSYDYEIGAFIGTKKSVIDYCIYDLGIKQDDKQMYIPNTVYLNEKLEEWYESGIEVVGFIHCHRDNCVLSYADKLFARSIMINNGIDEFCMGILNLDTLLITYYIVQLS